MNSTDIRYILDHPESELLECKHAERSFDFDDIGKYFSALSNEANLLGKSSAWLVFGVQDKTHQILGTAYRASGRTLHSLKKEIADKTTNRISFINIFDLVIDEKRVVVFQIPPAPHGIPIARNGHYYARDDESLVPLNLEKIERIRKQHIISDRSGLACEGTTIDDLDPIALQFIKDKKSQISRRDEYKTMDTKMFLNQISLLTQDGIPNHTCILFLGKQEVAEKKLPAVSRFAWLYIDEKNGKEDRLTPEQQRSPLIFTIYHIIDKIQKYNMPLEDLTLFRSDTEYQYHEKAIEELIANSLAHRDREIPIHNEVRQTPISLIFSNPGKFNNDLEKVLAYSQFSPYKNQTMADFLSKINLMENERRGLQKVFSLQLSKGVFVHKEDLDNNHGGIVKMILDGKVVDINFAKLVFQIKNMSRLDMLLLQKISEGANFIGKHISLEQAEDLEKKGYIEIYGKKPHKKVRIGYDLLDEIGQTEKYILNKGIGTKKKEKLILEYIEKKGLISTKETYKLFPEAEKSSLRRILHTMSRAGLIVSCGFGKYKKP